jgi:hypothetical protein
VVTVLITLYRKPGVVEPYYITQCISSLLKEMQTREAQIIDPILVRFPPIFCAVTSWRIEQFTVNI